MLEDVVVVTLVVVVEGGDGGSLWLSIRESARTKGLLHSEALGWTYWRKRQYSMLFCSILLFRSVNKASQVVEGNLVIPCSLIPHCMA